MAIFSQLDSQTEVDFRNYNYVKPNRMVPYQLDLSIEVKLYRAMQKVGLSYGSIDLIRGKNGVYYFLEVNPVGQFGFVSSACNYSLEKKVVDYITNNNP